MRSEIDIKALQGFLDESNDSLQAIEADFIELEKDPANLEIINRIFRPIHSLKGNSGFFGLTNINKFAHRLENLLDTIRKGDLLVTVEIVDILLHGADHLAKMLDRAAKNPDDVELRPSEEDFLAKVESCQPAPKTGSVQSLIQLRKLLEEAMEFGLKIRGNSLLENLFGQMENANQELARFIQKSKAAATESIFRADTAYFFGDRDLTVLLRPLDEALNSLGRKEPISGDRLKEFTAGLKELKGIAAASKELTDILDELGSMANFLDDELMAGNDEFRLGVAGSVKSLLGHFEARGLGAGKGERLGEILLEQQLVSPADLTAALNQQKKVGEILLADGKIKPTDLERALEVQNKRSLESNKQEAAKDREILKTIRIDQAQLDNFANYVGELFIALDSFNFLKKHMDDEEVDPGIIAKFTNTTLSLDRLADKLQDSVMGIRKVQVNTLFQRFPRVIRQLAGSLGKDIDFRIRGDETVIDKDLLEKIENPLVHLLRNSVDHGIEIPAIRTAGNKPAKGTLELHASVDENFVYLIIKDDGAGIDPLKIKQVAVKKGFLSEAEAAALSDKELINLIFRPGFSSAEKISDVSGRGVGMDVVLSGLKECKGSINVDSVVNAGTTIRIAIPLTKTLVAKDAMILNICGQTFALPSEDVTASIEISENTGVHLFTDDNCITYGDAVLPVLNLASFFYPAGACSQKREDRRQVAIVCREQKLALLVDRVLNHQKIVVKNFTGGYKKFKDIKGISGYTILGNEDVVLILDVRKIGNTLQ